VHLVYNVQLLELKHFVYDDVVFLIIIESANEVIQTQNTSNRNKWWDELCKLIMTQKNEARKKYLQVKTRASREMYETKRTEANRVCREKKRIWINNKIKQIEETINKNETRKFFKEAQYFNKQQLVLPKFGRTKVVTYCQNIETFYKDGNNTSVTYKAPAPDIRN